MIASILPSRKARRVRHADEIRPTSEGPGDPRHPHKFLFPSESENFAVIRISLRTCSATTINSIMYSARCAHNSVQAWECHRSKTLGGTTHSVVLYDSVSQF
jgi:hypothetical protein